MLVLFYYTDCLFDFGNENIDDDYTEEFKQTSPNLEKLWTKLFDWFKLNWFWKLFSILLLIYKVGSKTASKYLI